jgi:hypothetical protein
VISLETLTAELRKGKRSSDWSVVERVTRRGTSRPRDGFHRIDDDSWIELVVHRDVGRGRGTGEVELAGDRGDDPASIVAEAEARALAMIGPAWTTPAPAAPARVDLVDDQLVDIVPSTAPTALVGLATGTDAEAVVEHITVRLATGGISGRELAVTWTETRVRVRATIERDGHTVEIAAEARRIADLHLDARLRGAIGELGDRAGAAAPAPGVYTVVLRAAAHAHGGYGLWQALVAQADGALVRQGLSRYRLGSEIAPRASHVDEPLDVTSDGTLPFGIRSAPAGDRGEPVRRFAVVERGIARGLSLDQREGSLAQREPNGGIRNLVIGAGTTPIGELIAPAAGATIVDVDRLAWLDLDPRTGTAVARIAAGGIRDAGGRRPIAGGTLRLDAIAAIASARRSRELATEGAVLGPAALRVDGVAITE